MALAFFGKGIGGAGLGRGLRHRRRRRSPGLSGGLFNMFGNISVDHDADRDRLHRPGTGSFNGALVFIGANAFVAT